MEIKGCEKLTDANIIIAYELSSENAKAKTKFHDTLYGRKKEGILFRIPHRKLARGVIEISQRNLNDVRSIFEKFGVHYELRLTLPVRDSSQIVAITKTIEDPYEKAIQLDSIAFGEFAISKLEKIGKDSLKSEDISDELLSLKDTMEKWVKGHRQEPLASEFAYMSDALKTVEDKFPEEARRNTLRIAESLRHWIVGYRVLNGSKDNESIGNVLKKYSAAKNRP